MIPNFPEFTKLTLENAKDVEEHTLKFPYYSDYHFSSLWSWDIEKKREVSILNGNLVVKFTDYETHEPFLSFLGMNETLETTNTLLDYSESIGLKPILKLMPEISVHDIDSPELSIEADRDNFDYIYLASQIASMAGNQHKSKRHAASYFERNAPNHTFKVLNLTEPRAQGAVRAITRDWLARRDKTIDDQSIAHEMEAIENILTFANHRELIVGIVRTDGIPTSYTIEEIVNNIFSIGHFWKTARKNDGEYEFLAKKMSEYLHKHEITYLNWEQDLGIETLRVSKSSYRPSDFLKKFIVSRRPLPMQEAGAEGI